MYFLKFWVVMGTVLGFWSAIAGRSIAQTIPISDGTTGSVVVPGGVTLIDGGTQRGSALFHSFRDFNVGVSDRVYFSNPVGVTDILSRVTGANPSNIFGTLGVNGSANLFLINPRGIVFGKDAKLDIAGGFVASTADRWILGDGSSYQATNPNAPPSLAVNISPGLQYGATATTVQRPGDIINFGNLRVGGGFQLAANRIEFQGGTLSAEKNIILYAPTIQLSNQSLISSNASANATQKAGDIAIQTQSLSMTDGSIISTSTFSTQGIQAGDIYILPLDPTQPSTVSINGYAQFKGLKYFPNGTPYSDGGYSSGIFVSTEDNPDGTTKTTGDAGNLYLNGITNLNLENGGVISGRSFSQGAGSNIYINVTNLSITGGAQITVPAYKTGIPGNIVINAENINISGYDPMFSKRFRDVEEAYRNAGKSATEAYEQAQFTVDPFTAASGLQSSLLVGNGSRKRGAGAIVVNAGSSLTITDQGDISSNTYGQGDGGFISISAGQSYPSLQAFATQVLATYDSPDLTTRLSLGGDKGRIVLDQSGTIRTSTFRGAKGNAGLINVSTGTLSLDHDSSIQSNVGTDSVGNAGEVNIRTNRLTLDHDSLIQSTLLKNAKGDAGTIRILSTDTTLNRSSLIQSNVSSGAVGNAGGILIVGKTLTVQEGSQIQTVVFRPLDGKPGGNGNAGAIIIKADDFIKLTGRSGEFGSGILSSIESGATGETSGLVLLQASLLYLNDGAYINTSNFSGKGTAGYVLAIADFVVLDRSSRITSASLSGQGGNIGLESRYLVGVSRGSRISTAAGSLQGGGTGGSVAIGPDLTFDSQDNVILNSNLQTLLTYGFPYKNTDIVANAFDGPGGRIDLSTLALRNLAKRKDTAISDDLDATSNRVGLNGTVNINTFNLDVDRGLQPMSDRFRDYVLSEGCDPRTRQEANSLKQVGTGLVAQDATQQLERRTTIAAIPITSPTDSTITPRAETQIPIAANANTSPNALIPAQGWTQTPDGKLQFIAASLPTSLTHSGIPQNQLCPANGL